MNTPTFTYLLEHPENLSIGQTAEMRAVIDQFPYFQSAHALYLKGLKNQESFAYNKALKITAAHSADRSVLFEYITSEVFNQNDISEQIKLKEQNLRGLMVSAMEDVSMQLETEELAKADQILDPELFVEKKDSEMTAIAPEEILKVGKPLEFSISETHSFGEWLKLAAFKPIVRTAEAKQNPKDLKSTPEPTVSKVPEALSSNETSEESEQDEAGIRKRKQQIIDAFIDNNPKIKVSPSINSPKKNLAKEQLIPSEVLMTETLARVYIEQKNFKKAKQAYRILSLKYPEKNGFFADQIRAVEQLEANKEL